MADAIPMIQMCAERQRGRIPRWACQRCGDVKPEGRTDPLCRSCRNEVMLLDWLAIGAQP